MKLGLIGLGNMGAGLAASLLRAGHELAVYNRSPRKAEALLAKGATLASSPADAARGAEAVVTIVADDAAVEAVAFGRRLDGVDGAAAPESLAARLAPGAVHVSMSTIAPSTSRRLEQAHRRLGQEYVAAPVLGRPDVAERGQLAVVAAGSAKALDRCAPLFDAVGRTTHRLGDQPERANVVKLATNFVLASMIESLGEAMAVVEAHGIDAAAFLSVANGSLFKSDVLGAYGARIAEERFEPGFRLKLGLKDVRLALEAGESALVPMPIASVLRDRFLAALAGGLAEADWSAVARVARGRGTPAGEGEE